MAEEWTAWESVTSDNIPGVPEGLLPLDNPAEAFQYRKWIDAFFPFAGIDLTGGGGSYIVTGTWKVRLNDRGSIRFEQEVELRFEVIVQVVLGQVGFFFWSPMDGGNGRITTTIADGQEVPLDAEGKREGWRFVDTSTPTPFSEFGDTRFDFGDTGSFTTEGGFIRATWYSPQYRTELQQGTVLEIEFDRWQVGVLRESTYQFSFRGAPKFSSFLDLVGGLRLGTAEGSLVVTRFSYDGEHGLTGRSRVSGLRQPSEWKDATNRMWRAAWQGPEGDIWYRLFSSENDGRTWGPLLLPAAEEGGVATMPVTIWNDDFTAPHTCGLKNGGAASVALKAGRIYVKVAADLRLWAGEMIVMIPQGAGLSPVEARGVYHIREEIVGTRLILTNGAGHVLSSDDSGKSWRHL